MKPGDEGLGGGDLGYTVEFLSLNWDDAAAALRGDRGDLGDAILAANAESAMWRGAGQRAEAEEALRDLLGGELGRELARQGAEPAGEETRDASDAQAAAFVALLRHLGAAAGELAHNSKAGRDFRDRFLERTLPSALGPIDWYRLVDRPLFGLTHAGYPTWGGLRAGECGAIRLDGIADLEDSDEQDWLDEVAAAIEFANRRGTDLVALYY